MTRPIFIQYAAIDIYAAGINNPEINEASAVAAATTLADAVHAVAPFTHPGEDLARELAKIAWETKAVPALAARERAAPAYTAPVLDTPHQPSGPIVVAFRAMRKLLSAILQRRNYVLFTQASATTNTFEASCEESWIVRIVAEVIVREEMETAVNWHVQALKRAAEAQNA